MMDTQTWARIKRAAHGEILILVSDYRDASMRVKQESEIRFHALHELNTKWIKEVLYELRDCSIIDTTEYLDIRFRDMAKLN